MLRVAGEFQEARIDRLHHPILDEGNTLGGVVQQQSATFIKCQQVSAHLSTFLIPRLSQTIYLFVP